MNSALQRYATPLITGLFLVSLISGVALFFHLGANYFREMHEWLSLVLIVPFVLHIWKNGRAMMAYFKRPAFALAMVASLAMALVFVYQAGNEAGRDGRAGGPPQFALAQALMANPVSQVAPLLGYTPEGLVQHLKDAGFSAAAVEAKITDIATASGKNTFEMAAALLPAAK